MSLFLSPFKLLLSCNLNWQAAIQDYKLATPLSDVLKPLQQMPSLNYCVISTQIFYPYAHVSKPLCEITVCIGASKVNWCLPISRNF